MSPADKDAKSLEGTWSSAALQRGAELLTLAVGLGGSALLVYGALRAREHLADFFFFWVLALAACPSRPPARAGRALATTNWLALGASVLMFLIVIITSVSSRGGWGTPLLGAAVCCSALGHLIEMYQAPQDGPLPRRVALSALSVLGLAMWLWIQTHPDPGAS